MSERILTLNAGSSSVKFALFEREAARLDELARGQLEGLGARPRFAAQGVVGSSQEAWEAGGPADPGEAIEHVLAWLRARGVGDNVAAVGHRIVHGGPDLAAPAPITPELRAQLEALAPLAPLHQPHNLAGVDAAARALPHAIQVACFDTAFHRQHPWVADTFALPTRFYDAGVRRYGFHGLSYEFIAARLAAEEPALAGGRVIIAHLGNGASMCAVKAGRSIGSTMGFTALDGLPMGTRCGQIDPGVVLYLMAEQGMSADAVTELLYRDSGLKGLSGLSHDLRILEAEGSRAAEGAIAYYVHRIRREVGALSAVLEGLDALVFTGGVGENSARIRAEVCRPMSWLGIALDEEANRAGARDIGAADARVRVLRLQTDEEAMIARHARDVLAAAPR